MSSWIEVLGITKVAALRIRLTCSDEDDFRNNRVLGMPDSETFLRSISNLTKEMACLCER